MNNRNKEKISIMVLALTTTICFFIEFVQALMDIKGYVRHFYNYIPPRSQ